MIVKLSWQPTMMLLFVHLVHYVVMATFLGTLPETEVLELGLQFAEGRCSSLVSFSKCNLLLFLMYSLLKNYPEKSPHTFVYIFC